MQKLAESKDRRDTLKKEIRKAGSLGEMDEPGLGAMVSGPVILGIGLAAAIAFITKQVKDFTAEWEGNRALRELAEGRINEQQYSMSLNAPGASGGMSLFGGGLLPSFPMWIMVPVIAAGGFFLTRWLIEQSKA